MTLPPKSPAAFAAQVDAAASLLATQPREAEAMARQLANLAPSDPRPALVLASALRRQGDAEAALNILLPLAKAWPKAATTRYELGVSLAALGREADALEALRLAVSLKPDLPEAWGALGELHFRRGEVEASDAAYAQQGLWATEPRLRPAAEALAKGELERAEQMLADLIRAKPDDVAALHLMGDLYIRRERFADAETLLSSALVLHPERKGARFLLANAYFQQQKAREARDTLAPLLAEAPDDAAYLNLQAAVLALLGRDDLVIGVYDRLLAAYPSQPRIWLNAGHALRTVGRTEEAIAAYRRCLALAPQTGDAYWSLANLKAVRFTPEDEEAMAVALTRPDLADDDRLHLHFALGKALEDARQFGPAFQHYAEGAAIRRRKTPYDASLLTAQIDAALKTFTADFFDQRRDLGDPSPEPIFILGLPRSGSTLIEQILASHSKVEGTMELPHIGHLAQAFNASEPEGVARLTPHQLKEMGQAYLRASTDHRRLGRPYFIDKMPNNFVHLALIRLILPNAKIIDARRHPLGVCFSAFKQHFALGQNFSYDLTDLGLYYRDYLRLARHMHAVQPGRVHTLFYEDMVEDTEAEVRRLLDYCGLAFEPSCLTFYQTERAVRTVSSEQVRQPIYRGGLEQWRNFEPDLGPLKAALGGALQTWRQ